MIQALANGLQLRLELLVLYRESAVRILQQCLKILDALVAGKQLALCDPSLLLERRVLIDKLKKGFSIWSPSTCFSPNKADGHTHLLLHKRELLEVALKERHLLLLLLAVRVADDVVVLLLHLIQLNLELDHLRQAICEPREGDTANLLPHLLTAVLKIAHQRLLDAVELGELNVDCLARSLEVAGALGQVFATLDPSRSDGECTLSNEDADQCLRIDVMTRGSPPHLQLLVDALEALHVRVEVANLIDLELELLFEVGDFVQVDIPLRAVLSLDLLCATDE